MPPVILIVDDKPQNVALLLAILKNEGYQFLVANSGEEAIEKIRSLEPDVVLLDVLMPGMSGEEVCRWVHQSQGDHGPMLVIVTAEPDTALRLRCKEAGCDDFLLKPVIAAEVRGQVRRFVDLKAARDAAAGRVARLVEESTKWQNRIEQVERLALLGTLAAGVGHELNNVATILIAALDEIKGLAGEGLPVDGPLLEDLSLASRHVATHASNLLALGRPPVPNAPAAPDVRAVAERAIGIMAHSGRAKFVKFDLQATGSDFTTTASTVRIEQVLINLLANAADVLNEGKVKEPAISVRIGPGAAGRTLFAVSDNGPGISDSVRARLFEPYFTTKTSGRGTGLGLPVARQIVESYGGQITCESEPGKGTTFTFDLPAGAPIQPLSVPPPPETMR